MSAIIRGLASAAPRCSINQRHSLAFAETILHDPELRRRGLRAIYRISSVQRRGSVLLDHDMLGEEAVLAQSFYPPADSQMQRGPRTAERNERFAAEALRLSLPAAREAIRRAEIEPAGIGHLVVVTCTGFSSPGVDVGLIEELELSPETQRVQVGFMGCHGAINALRVARGLVAAEPDASVLIVCVELCSLHYQYGDRTDSLISNAIFADGAAAMVVGGERPRTAATRNGSPSPGDGLGGRLKLVATGSRLIADSREAMTWRIGDHGFEMTLAATVPGIIEAELAGYLADWLSRHGLTIDEVNGWAVHPGGPRILTAVQSALGLESGDLQTARDVLATHGNMSSPTMLFILERFLAEQRPRPWVMLGFGPGLEVEVALIR